MEIYLIRHGRTLCNEKNLYYGKGDVSISELGKAELKVLKQEITYPICELYYTSGAKRANETFAILYPNEKYEVKNGFWEYDFGDFEMKSYDEIKDDENYKSWFNDKKGDIYCPNGENKNNYFIRVKKAFNEVVEECYRKNIKSALIVSHSGTIGTILEHFYDNSKTLYEYQADCGRGYKTIVKYENNKAKIMYIEEL